MTRKTLLIPAAVALALGITSAASAHTPTFSVSCASGLDVSGTQYQGGTVDITYGSRHQRTTFVTSFVLHVPTPDPTIVESYVVIIDAIDGTEFDHTYTGSVQPCMTTATTSTTSSVATTSTSSTMLSPASTTSAPATAAPTTTTEAPATTATSSPTAPTPSTTSTTDSSPNSDPTTSSSTSTSDVAVIAPAPPPPAGGLPETGSELVVPLALFATACFVTGLGLRRTTRRRS